MQFITWFCEEAGSMAGEMGRRIADDKICD